MLNNLKEKILIDKAPGIFHKYIANRFKAYLEINSNVIKRKDAIYIMTRHMNTDCVQKFLNEMEEYDLIKVKDKQNIEILD